MNREIKFRAWDKEEKMVRPIESINWDTLEIAFNDSASVKDDIRMYGDMGSDVTLLQYTGLKDKNGVEIYEFMELNGKWEVGWVAGRYILRDISSGDIIDMDYENIYEITREYTKIQENSKGGTN